MVQAHDLTGGVKTNDFDLVVVGDEFRVIAPVDHLEVQLNRRCNSKHLKLALKNAGRGCQHLNCAGGEVDLGMYVHIQVILIADVIVPALLAVQMVMRQAGSESIRIPYVGLKDGLLFELAPEPATPATLDRH